MIYLIGLMGLGYLCKKAYNKSNERVQDTLSLEDKLRAIDINVDIGKKPQYDIRDTLDKMNIENKKKLILNDAVVYKPSTQPNDSDGSFNNATKNRDLKKIDGNEKSFNPVTNVDGYIHFNGSRYRYPNN